MGVPLYRVDPKLYEFATVRQLEYLEAIQKHKSLKAAARAMRVNYSVIHAALKMVERKAAIHGYAPQHDLTHTLAPGQMLRGASMLYKAGQTEPAMVWVKTRTDDEQREQIIREFVKTLTEDCRGLAPITPTPKHCFDDLLAVYPLGDPHFGLYSWAKETGDNFDLDIAKRLTLGAVDRLVEVAPAASTAILLPLGDIFHMDDQTNKTPGHGHQLDADGRFPKVLQVGVLAFRHATLRLLEKHEKVIVRFVKGNHDPNAVWGLAVATQAFFENEPRVEVDLTPSDHWFYRFGSVLIGATHGDKTKHPQLLGVMAADRPEDWGATKHRYFYTGHVHNQVVTELPGLLCESFRTLAAKDAYAAGYGYRAGRDMRCIILHKDHGEIERHRCDLGMIA